MKNQSARSNLGLLRVVWRVTRGWRGICYGAEFWISVVVWSLTAPYWLESGWWAQPLSILPTVLGFTITGFAIFLGFGSDDFKRFLARGRSVDDNSYMSVGAAFVFFVCIQLSAILFALIVNAFQFPTPDFLYDYRRWIDWGNRVAGGVGYFLFLYGILLALRAALRIYRLSRWYMKYLIATDKKGKKFSQISSAKDSDGVMVLHAIDTDGTAWTARMSTRNNRLLGSWRKIKALPLE